jgi:uncharacterized protein
MSENQIRPISSQERIELLDVLRGMAIGGILIGNMQWFSNYGMMPETIAAQAPLIDKIANFFVHFLVEGKFYSIFSFLFGFGFALQMTRAEERGDLKAALFKRRLFWLLIIGLLHAYLFWAGDILSIYALMGFALILFRKKTNESLLKWIFGLILVPIFSYILFYVLFAAFVTPEILAEIGKAKMSMWEDGNRQVQQSGYAQIVSGFNLQFIGGRYASLILEMRLPKILAMFLLGFYAYRRGFFQNPSAHQPLIRQVLIYGLGLGLAANLVFAWVSGKEALFPPTLAGFVGVVLYAFGVPALALGFMALTATLWQKTSWQKLLAVLAPVGRMALTNYLMQTLICVFIFYGFGFGQFGKFGAARATLTALGIFVFQIFFSSLWLKYFNYGLMEWIWRQLTYRQRLNLRLKN